jgi:hypothetical protein
VSTHALTLPALVKRMTHVCSATVTPGNRTITVCLVLLGEHL